MKKSSYIFLFVSFFSLMIISITVSATKFVELKPQEVVDRAEVIIAGKYDFTSKPKPGGIVFQGFDFNIKDVYKGDVSEQITAGIDHNDIGWAEEFQNEEGEFLLFLERSKDADFLIPVAGPNGMIQVYNGKVEDQNDERKSYFEDFLKSQPIKTIGTKFKADNDTQNDKSYLLLYVSVSVLVGMAVLFILYRFKRKK